MSIPIAIPKFSSTADIPEAHFHKEFRNPTDSLAYTRKPYVLAQKLNLTVSEVKFIASYAIHAHKIKYIKNLCNTPKSIILFILRYMIRGMSLETSLNHLHYKSLAQREWHKERYKRWKK